MEHRTHAPLSDHHPNKCSGLIALSGNPTRARSSMRSPLPCAMCSYPIAPRALCRVVWCSDTSQQVHQRSYMIKQGQETESARTFFCGDSASKSNSIIQIHYIYHIVCQTKCAKCIKIHQIITGHMNCIIFLNEYYRALLFWGYKQWIVGGSIHYILSYIVAATTHCLYQNKNREIASKLR